MIDKVVIGNATLYHGDCREILPTLPKVDSVITDPPYGLGAKWSGSGSKTNKKWRFSASEIMAWDMEAPVWVPELATFADEVIIWGGNYFPMPPNRCWLVWDKKQNDSFTSGQCELAWTNLDKTIRTFRFAQCELANEGKKEHPTQKPLALMEWCFKWVSGQLVLDPFMGSGTTGVACINLGRSFIGIERERKYFDIACERIAAASAQGRLFA